MPTPTRVRLPQWSVRFRISAAILVTATLGFVVAFSAAAILQTAREMDEIDALLLARVEAARAVVEGAPDAPGAADAVDPAQPAPDSTPVPPGAAVPDAYGSAAEAMRAILERVVPSDTESSLGIVDGVPRYVPGTDVTFQVQEDAELVARVVAETADGSVAQGAIDSAVFGDIRYVAVPVVVPGAADRGVFLSVVDVDAELEDEVAAFTILAVAGAVVLAAIGAVAWFVSGRLLRPIRVLRETAERTTVTRRGERIPVVGNDDVSRLTRTVNDMLDRLDDGITGQRQLLDDVRHELGTPLTIVRGHLELLDPDDPDDVAATRALAIDELDRMGVLVADLQTLAESQRAVVDPQPEPVDDLTRDVFAKVSRLAGHEWRLGAVAHTVVRLDAGRIQQAWLQLVDNARKYSPEGTEITIGSDAAGGEVEFWVADRGPGVPAGSRERIFERFGRADAGRGIRGSGLGLAIVGGIARAHGGRVTLTTSPSGSRFGVVIPIGKDGAP